MPKQSRGFWVCISCEQAFDQYSEAQHHEQFSCSRRTPMVATVRPSPWQETTAVRPATFSSDPGPPGIQMQRGAEQPPFDSKLAPPLQRYIPVLGPQDPSPLRNQIDTLVCRSSEFFEVLTPDAGPAVGQVGLRCGFCVESPQSIRSYVFPSNTRSVAVSLRQPMLAHLKECPRYPEEYKQTLRGEPGDLRALGDFCLSRCHVAGVVDRHGGGLVFARAQPQPPPPYYQPPEPRDDSASVSRGDQYSTGGFVPDVPSGFPFIFVENSRWICKYCARIPPPYRDAQNFWPHVSPPDARFIDYHLSVCREFQKTTYIPAHEVRGTMHPTGYAPWLESQGTPGGPPPYRGSAMPPSMYVPPPAPAVGLPPDQQMEPGDAEAAQAIDYLEAHDLSSFDNSGNPIAPDNRLVLEDDRLMLTEYFFYLMKQLRQVKFSEADRRTRGGKREKVKVGYGGLQCVHCVDIPQSRKFFWSNVDRLANSFAEIPAHIFRCKRCPQSTKDALLLLKKRHPEQMSRLPRGSQKIFFRRMWRRLHEEDTNQGEQDRFEAPPPSETAQPLKTDVSQSTGVGSEESAYFLRRPSGEAAKTLVDGSMQPGPPSPKSRVLLAIPEDRQWLSDMDCFTRRQLEVFCATAEDIADASGDKKHPIQEGQVGIRCLHCAMASTPARGSSVAYPFSISGIYETAREFERLHLENCEHLPLSAKSKMESLKKGASSLSSIVRKYFVMAAKALGLEDTDNGIRAGATPREIGSQAKFAFAEIGSSPSPAEGTKKRKASSPASDAEVNPKRPAVDNSQQEVRQQSSTSDEDASSLKQAAI